MGGRGGSSGVSKREPVSKLMSKVYYNSAKKSTALRSDYTVERDAVIEKAIRNGDASFIQSISNEKEARRVSEYLTGRVAESDRKLAKLGSAEAVYKNQKAAAEHRDIVSMSVAMRGKMHEFSERPTSGNTNIHDTSRTTTTYDKARKRRMSNFDACFFGGKK